MLFVFCKKNFTEIIKNSVNDYECLMCGKTKISVNFKASWSKQQKY